MKTLKNLPKSHQKDLIIKMYRFAGYKPSEVRIDNDNWYSNYTWTEKQEEAFRQWFYKKVKTNKRFRKHYFSLPPTNNIVKEALSWFILDYAPKTIRDESD